MSYRSELIQVAAVAVAMIQDADSGSTYIGNPDGSNHQDEILKEILLEREAQERKWGEQHHLPENWLAILTEEVGEVAKDINEDNY